MFSQFPVFFRGYMSRLDAHIMELELVLSHYDQISENMNVSMNEMILQLESGSSPIQKMQAQAIRSLVTRHESLLESQSALVESSWWAAPFILLWHYDSSLASGAWSYYRFSIAFTEEALQYAILGFLFSLLLAFAGLRGIRSIKR